MILDRNITVLQFTLEGAGAKIIAFPFEMWREIQTTPPKVPISTARNSYSAS